MPGRLQRYDSIGRWLQVPEKRLCYPYIVIFIYFFCLKIHRLHFSASIKYKKERHFTRKGEDSAPTGGHSTENNLLNAEPNAFFVQNKFLPVFLSPE